MGGDGEISEIVTSDKGNMRILTDLREEIGAFQIETPLTPAGS